MRTTILLFLGLLCMGTSAFCHDSFFGFAEMEYKEGEKSIEATIILSAHDIHESLVKKGIISTDFEKLAHDSLTITSIGNEILSGFSVRSGRSSVNFHAVEFELTKNGLLLVYLVARDVVLENEFEVEFSTLMDELPAQQNKITYINNLQKQTAVFLKNKKTQKLTK